MGSIESYNFRCRIIFDRNRSLLDFPLIVVVRYHMRLNEVTETLPETVAALRTSTEAAQCISNELPGMVREQCLEEYKKIFTKRITTR